MGQIFGGGGGSFSLLQSGNLTAINTTYQSINLNGIIPVDIYNACALSLYFTAIPNTATVRMRVGINGTLLTAANTYSTAIGALGSATYFELTTASSGAGDCQIYLRNLLGFFTTRTPNYPAQSIEGIRRRSLAWGINGAILSGEVLSVSPALPIDTIAFATSTGSNMALAYKLWGIK